MSPLPCSPSSRRRRKWRRRQEEEEEVEQEAYRLAVSTRTMSESNACPLASLQGALTKALMLMQQR
jgi:hypothetical protein